MKALKGYVSEGYNFIFNRKTGLFKRWGTSLEDDPIRCEFGPEILDLEISKGGGCLGNCPFCYKNNGGDKEIINLSLDSFKKILSKFNLKILTQIAFGIMNFNSNPDFFPMMEHARRNGIIPNYTTHGLDMTPEYAQKTVKLCGAVAVSVVDIEKTLDAVKMLTDAGMKQVNIHYMLSEETYESALKFLEIVCNDQRIKKLNAVVFLQYKPKGRGTNKYTALTDYKKLKVLRHKAVGYNISIGFDSCSAPLCMRGIDNVDTLAYIEPCESGLFSSYINAEGMFFPCSFTEGTSGWVNGLDVLNCDSFTKDIWNSPRMNNWRDKLLSKKTKEVCHNCKVEKQCRVCPVYDLACK